MIGRTSLLGLATRNIGIANLRLGFGARSPASFQAATTLSMTKLGFVARKTAGAPAGRWRRMQNLTVRSYQSASIPRRHRANGVSTPGSVTTASREILWDVGLRKCTCPGCSRTAKGAPDIESPPEESVLGVPREASSLVEWTGASWSEIIQMLTHFSYR